MHVDLVLSDSRMADSDNNITRPVVHSGPLAATPTDRECSGHGVPSPAPPPSYPKGHCTYCGGRVTPFVAPPPPIPRPAPGEIEPGVQRSSDGHIIGIVWGDLPTTGPTACLRAWKDRPIGPGHPLASHIDPRSFIPSAARAPQVPQPTLATRDASVCGTAAQPTSGVPS